MREHLTNHNNNFDFLRLSAAIMVWYSHCHALLKLPDPMEAQLGFKSFGNLGVAIFFVISGYFITASYDKRQKLLPFLKSRCLRIFPPLIVVIILSVFVVGTIFTSLDLKDYFSNPDTWRYLNTMLVFPMHYELPGVFKDNPISAINGSLWTLKRELRLYLIIAALGFIGILRPRLLIAVLIGVYLIRIAPIFEYIEIPKKLKTLQPESLFIGGSVMYLARNLISLNYKFFMGAGLILLSSLYITNDFNNILFDFALTYIIIYLGFAKIPLLNKASKYGDFSYGFYLYAFPIQQILIHFMGKNLNFSLFLNTSFISIFICAILSWHFIEKPALKRFKKSI